MTGLLLMTVTGGVIAAGCYMAGYLRGLADGTAGAQAAAKLAVSAEQARCLLTKMQTKESIERRMENAGLLPLPPKQMLWKNN